MLKNLLLVIMSNVIREIRQKYDAYIEANTITVMDGGVVRKVVEAELAKELIHDALKKYMQMNTVPRVDFWGQPIDE